MACWVKTLYPGTAKEADATILCPKDGDGVFSKQLISSYQTSQCHNQADCFGNFNCHENLASEMCKYSQLCARVDLATSVATTIAVYEVTKLATKWITVVTSAMNLIAHVQVRITSAVHLVSAFLPVSAVTVTLIVQMQVMKCIVRVSKNCYGRWPTT